MDLFQCDFPTALFFKFVTGEWRDNIFLDHLDLLLLILSVLFICSLFPVIVYI